MIRINLLSEGKRPAAVRKKAPGAGFTEREDVAVILLVLMLVLGAVAAGAWWWIVDGQLEAKKEEVARTQEEVDRLQEVLLQVEEFKAKKAELEHKIQVINDLKANQRGPVRLMDNISRALPELLWIDQMRMSPNNVTLTGRAFNVNAVANFIERLDQVPEFQEPTRTQLNQSGAVYRYQIAFNYTNVPLLSPDEEAGDETETEGAAGADADATTTGATPAAAGG